MLAVILAAGALLPMADKAGGPVPTASSAEAAAILNATATSTRSALPAVRPGEYMFARTSLTGPGMGAATVVTKSWTATDGFGADRRPRAFEPRT